MADLGKLLLRLAVGGLMLFHGASKLVHGVSGIVGLVRSRGLPGFVGYAVLIGEMVAPFLIVIGLFTRPAALVLALNMVVAIWLVHLRDLFQIGQGGGYALELQLLYLVGAMSIALLGAGRYSVSRGVGRWN
jgi:putative oxidoreductase